MSKVICLDLATLMFRAIFNYERQLINGGNDFILPPHYVYFTMICSALKKIGINKDSDIVLAMLEGRSWRKFLNSDYKAHREKERQRHEILDWESLYKDFNRVNSQLAESTPFHFLRVWNAEADDLIAIACRYFSDKEVIIVSIDGDLKQLLYYPNVKFFTLMQKINGTRGIYDTTVKNPLSIIEQKVRKGDVSDNILVDKENDTEEDVALRYQLVNLLELPKEVEEPIIEILSNLPKKELKLELLPSFKNVQEKFLKIYEKDNIISFEDCVKLTEKRIKRKKEEKEQIKKEKKNGKQMEAK